MKFTSCPPSTPFLCSFFSSLDIFLFFFFILCHGRSNWDHILIPHFLPSPFAQSLSASTLESFTFAKIYQHMSIKYQQLNRSGLNYIIYISKILNSEYKFCFSETIALRWEECELSCLFVYYPQRLMISPPVMHPHPPWLYPSFPFSKIIHIFCRISICK